MSDPPIRAVLDASVLVPRWSRLAVNDFPPRDRDGRCRHAGIEYITAENFLRQVVRLDPEYLLQTELPDGRVRHERQVRSSTDA